MQKTRFNHKIINLGNKDEAIDFLTNLESNKSQYEYKVTNLGLTNLNKVCKGKVFHQEIAYVDYNTLKESMMKVGGKGKHNYHGLTAKEIIDALTSIKHAKKVYESRKNPNASIIVSSIIAECGYPIIVIIELNNSLHSERDLKINKISSLYPKRNLESFLNGLNVK